MDVVYGMVNGCGLWDGQSMGVVYHRKKLLNVKLLNIKAGKNQCGGFNLKFKPGGFFQTKLYQDQDGLYASILDAQFLEDGKALYRPPGWMVRHVQTTRLDGNLALYRPPGWMVRHVQTTRLDGKACTDHQAGW